MTTGAAIGPMSRSRMERVAGPPVDTPIATRSTGPVGVQAGRASLTAVPSSPATGDLACRCGGGSRCAASSRILRRSSESICPRSVGVKADCFDTKSAAPLCSARNVAAAPAWVWLLTMITIGFGVTSSVIRRVASMPSMTGISHIHRHDVRPQLARQRHRLLAVARLADHPHIAVGLDDLPQRDAHETEIVGHHDAERPGRVFLGAPHHQAALHSRSAAMMRSNPPSGRATTPATAPGSPAGAGTISDGCSLTSCFACSTPIAPSPPASRMMM